MSGSIVDGWSHHHFVVSISFGESELYEIVNDAARGIWTQNGLAEMDLEMRIKVQTDSSAVYGLAGKVWYDEDTIVEWFRLMDTRLHKSTAIADREEQRGDEGVRQPDELLGVWPLLGV